MTAVRDKPDLRSPSWDGNGLVTSSESPTFTAAMILRIQFGILARHRGGCLMKKLFQAAVVAEGVFRRVGAADNDSARVNEVSNHGRFGRRDIFSIRSDIGFARRI